MTRPMAGWAPPSFEYMIRTILLFTDVKPVRLDPR
jgi:hypothetical protein